MAEAILSSDDDEVRSPVDFSSPVDPRNDDDKAENPTFQVGDSFQAYADVERKLKEYERFYYVKFWKKEARTVESAKKG